jgi:hypothetical protein
MTAKTKGWGLAGWMLLLCAADACSSAPPYRYAPLEPGLAEWVGSRTEASYFVTSPAPSANVRVLSLGIVDVQDQTDSKTFAALHLRMSITNESSSAHWSFVGQDQFVSYPNEGKAQPSFVNADEPSIPRFEVKPGELRTFDFYFALPGEKDSARDLPAFDFHWSLQVVGPGGSRVVRETTPFDQVLKSVALTDSSPYPLGWGPVWWGGEVIVVRRQ